MQADQCSAAQKKRIQCKACPWRKDVVPERDIPGGYSKERHRNLKDTIAQTRRPEGTARRRSEDGVP